MEIATTAAMPNSSKRRRHYGARKIRLQTRDEYFEHNDHSEEYANQEDKITSGSNDRHDLVSRRRSNTANSSMSREAFIASISGYSNSSALTAHFTPTDNRIILTEIFVEGYFPNDGSVFQGYEYLNRTAPSCKAISYLLDLSYCLHAGVHKGDKRLLQTSRQYYQKALQSFRAELKNPDPDPGHIIGAIHILQSAELYADLGLEEFSWRRHIPGMLYAIQCSRSKKLEPQVQSLLSGNMRLFAVWDGLLQRKPLPRCDALWPMLCDTRIWGSSAQLNNIALRVPGALADVDTIMKYGKTASRDAVTHCMRNLMTIESDFHTFMAGLYSKIPGQAYWMTTAIPAMHVIGSSIGGDYPKLVYSFPSLGMAHLHTTYWLCLLSLREAQVDIRKVVTKTQYPFPFPKTVQERSIGETSECANHLVLSIPYMLEFARLNSGYMAILCALAPLQMATRWYKGQSDKVLLDFCERIGRYIQTFGLQCSLAETEAS